MKGIFLTALGVVAIAGGVLVWRMPSGPPATPKAATKQSLYVHVPGGLYLPLTYAMNEFKRQHPGVEFQTMVDDPGNLVTAVLENQDRPDIFISPGGHELRYLADKGFVRRGSEIAFGSYVLAVVVPKGNPGRVNRLEDLLNPQVKKISLSDPDVNSVGYATRQALTRLGLWDRLGGKIKNTGCCMESYRWVSDYYAPAANGRRDKRAEASFSFKSCPMTPETAERVADAKVAIACEVPPDAYFLPRTVAGVFTTSKRPRLAREFLEFLTSPKTLALMASKRFPNERSLPLRPAPGWGAQQEEIPVAASR